MQQLKKLKPILLDILVSSTSHGLPNIVRSDRKPITILWVLCTLISSGICAYLIIESILNFYQYEVTTKIRVVNEFNSTFPTVTVCNLNFLTTEHAANLSNSTLDPIDSFTEYTLRFRMPVGSDRRLYGDTKYKLIRKINLDVETIDHSKIKYYFHPENGNCYQINSGYDENGTEIPLVRMIRQGRIQGLFIYINVSIHKELKKVLQNLGGIVFIHNKTQSPVLVEGVTVSPGSVTNIGLTRTFSRLKPKPYSNCDGNLVDHDSSLYKLIFEKSGTYSQKACFDNCYQSELARQCNCIDFVIETLFDYPACFFYDECLIRVYKEVFNNLENFCLNKCPLECEKMYFTKTISTNQLGSEEWDENLRNIYGINSTRSMRDDLALVVVYYESLGYTEITEIETVSVVSLISNIGGIAGLFLGVSFLSFVEIFEAAFQILIVLFYDKIKIKTAIKN